MAAFDTGTDSNSSWATPVLMNEYVTGSNRVDQFNTLASGQQNIGAGTGYREYRALSASENRDELLQVWAYDDSYMLQYRNAASGAEAKQQAWSFGGNATTTMRTAGVANYKGRFAATAKTSNWYQPDSADVNPNALWQVQGDTTLAADFGTAKVTGTLTPETWTSFQESVGGNYTWYTGAYSGGVAAPSAATVAAPAYSFYNTTVGIDANIAQVTTPTPGNTPNYTGEATLSGGFVSGDNPVYGGFFGNDASETTGVFNVYGTMPQPIGGDDGINGDRRGYLTINGAFHANCVSGACTP